MAKKKEVSKKPVAKEKKGSGIKKYFRSVVSEMKKVTWPSRKELINSTIVVLTFILIFSVIVGIIDFGLGTLLELIT
ncbi:MAG: preprotein translocase subunit SecE [Caldicoprobacterales bacterium]|jgi:preprotein translocase subunit SecE|nr:preprotein translocase subunit SecE [Clostridiales bacterium]